MSVNKYLPHVLVLPEDDANRNVANGFHRDLALIKQMQVLPVAGGWKEVMNRFESEHISEMIRHPQRFMVLLIDFDNQAERLQKAKAAIPREMTDRVFVLGALSAPEDLKNTLGSYETIGSALARDCRDGTDATWGHTLLLHNASELDRLRQHVRPFLFQ